MLGWWGSGAGGAVSRPHPTETSPAQEAPDPAPRTSRTAGQSTEDISGAKDDGSLGPARIPVGRSNGRRIKVSRTTPGFPTKLFISPLGL